MSRFTQWSTTHRKAAMAGSAVVVLGVGVGAGFGFSDLGATSPAQTSTATSTSAASAKPAGAAPAKTATAKHHGVKGQITAENGTTWTVLSKKGTSVTVDLTSATMFGSKASPATQSQFVVGDTIVVVGTRSGTTVTAARIFTPFHAGSGAPSTSGTSASPTS